MVPVNPLYGIEVAVIAPVPDVLNDPPVPINKAAVEVAAVTPEKATLVAVVAVAAFPVVD
jgi:hypothetical protein